MVKRAIAFGVVRVMSMIFMAVGWGFDWSGTSLIGPQPTQWRIVALVVGIVVFIVATIWREVDLLMQPHPNMRHEAVSEIPYQGAVYWGLILRNRALPSGDASKSQQTRARVDALDTKLNTIGFWNGRWADNRWPMDYGDIDVQNRRDINAGDPARLDIGARRNAEAQFRAHYNWLPDSPEPPTILFNPGSYYIKVSLWAANMKKRLLWYKLDVPDEPQSQTIQRQVQITPIKKPKSHKVDSRT